MKLEFSLQIFFEKLLKYQTPGNYPKGNLLYIKFHENQSSVSRLVPCGRTDGQTWRS